MCLARSSTHQRDCDSGAQETGSSTLILVSFRQNKFFLKTACTVSGGLGLVVEGLLPRNGRFLAPDLSPQVLLKVSLSQSLQLPYLGLPNLEMPEVSPLEEVIQVKKSPPRHSGMYPQPFLS